MKLHPSQIAAIKPADKILKLSDGGSTPLTGDRHSPNTIDNTIPPAVSQYP